jgi:hypothetical protein
MDAETITDICNQIAEGKSLRAICRERGLPESSVRYHLNKDEVAFAQTARARELGCDALADECMEISDNPALDPADRRVRIETRLKLIGKWSQRYSDKLTVATTQTVTHRYELDGLSADELDTLERLAGKAAVARGDTSGAGETEPASLH